MSSVYINCKRKLKRHFLYFLSQQIVDIYLKSKQAACFPGTVSRNSRGAPHIPADNLAFFIFDRIGTGYGKSEIRCIRIKKKLIRAMDRWIPTRTYYKVAGEN